MTLGLRLAIVLSVACAASRSGAQAAVDTPPSRPATVTPAPRRTPALDRSITLTLRDAPLVEAIQAIDRMADLQLSYTEKILPSGWRVTIDAKAMRAGQALEQVLRGTGIVVRTTDTGHLMLVRREEPRTTKGSAGAGADSTQGVMWGQVRDSVTGQVIAGVQIGIRGTALGGVSNDSGYYFIHPVPYGPHTVVARRFGYDPLELVFVVTDSLLGPATRLDLRLRPHVEKMEQVVVTATGPQRRIEIANDITTINVDSVLATAPVHNVTELLETRVPGLEVQHSTGTPGAPSRIRLRGVSSITRDNNPIVVVDGIRIDIAESRTALLAHGSAATNSLNLRVPSRLDQIDPSSIETIEVFKGPSAAALYGSDAANGVIVITTKKGRSGPTHWQLSATQGISKLPGAFPTNLFRWGHSKFGGSIRCPPTQYDCTLDSLVAFQALSDPRYSPFGYGNRSDVSLSASGGGEALTYSFTGSASQELGILRLPDIEAQRYQKFLGSAPPGWMRRPDRLTTWSGSSQITAVLSPKATLAVQSTLTSQNQQQSSLQSAISELEGRWIDQTELSLIPLIPEFFERVTAKSLDFTTSASLNWRPWEWLPLTAIVGVSLDNRDDRSLLPANVRLGDHETSRDTLGHLGVGNTRVLTRTATVSTSIPTHLPLGMGLRTDLGLNLTTTAATLQGASTFGLLPGVNDPSVFNEGLTQSTSNQTTLGWFLAPTFAVTPRLFVTTGFRLDGGSTSGKHATFNGFPKLGFSWLASDEKLFPSALRSVVNTLRLRVAYGHAGVQPGLVDRLRLYGVPAIIGANGDTVPGTVSLQTYGNTQLRPERSTELEGGFDADLFDNRISIGYSGYRRVQHDAIIDVPIAPSVNGGGTRKVNIGEVRNQGFDVTLGVEALRSAALSWRFDVNFSTTTNKLLKLAADQTPIDLADGRRIVPGYPLFGQWARPIVGWADGLHDGIQDGIIDSTEVILGDSTIYRGWEQPRFHTSLFTTIGLFSNRVTVNASFDYQNGATQFNQAGGEAFLNAANDPNAPPATQAAVAAAGLTPFGLIQTVNTLRFNSLAVSVAMPEGAARAFGARSMFVTVQGSNLGLHTNYRGLDPNVNAFVGDGNVDTGQFPQPRTWSLGVRLGN